MIAILSCDVFQDEWALLLKTCPTAIRSVEWLRMGLHDQPLLLRSTVQQKILEMETQDPELTTILLAYGLCGNGLADIQAHRCQLILPRAHDCIAILLGGNAAHAAALKDNPGMYFYSPGWGRGRRVPGSERDLRLRALCSARHPDDPDLVDDLIEADHETFAHHNCAAYVDITADAQAEHYCRDCARHLRWDYRKLQGNPRLLQGLISGDWRDDDFLTIPPGRRSKLSTDGHLVID